LTDPRVANLGRVLVEYCTNVQEGDHVAIAGSPAAAPLIREVYRHVLRAGGYPYVMVALPGLDRIFFSEAAEHQINHISRFESLVRGEFEALIAIRSETNTRTLSGVSPDLQSMRQKAYTPLMETFMKRSATGEFKWCGTLFPTEAYAQEADMSLDEYEDFVYGTMFLDTDDPVGHWDALHARQQRFVDWLKGRRAIRVQGPNIDMTLSIEGRTFINSDGRHNMPSGEIFTGPVEDSVNGWVRFTYPAITHGREVDGIELEFRDGVVVKASAKKNEEFLLSQLDSDAGARRLGEWAIGTNDKIDRFTKSILFDEKIGGTIHMAIGAGYPETGSVNKSAVHWDMICDMRDGGRIWADDELFYDSGKFVI
jgi:aminopeptidase